MDVRRTLRTDPDEWNHPRRARIGMPLAARGGAVVGTLAGAAGILAGISPAILAGSGAAVGVLLGWLARATFD